MKVKATDKYRMREVEMEAQGIREEILKVKTDGTTAKNGIPEYFEMIYRNGNALYHESGWFIELTEEEEDRLITEDYNRTIEEAGA